MRRYVIVGNGVAGITAAQTIARADPSAEVHVFGAEPFPYYRRPRLWEFIAGELEQEKLYFRPQDWYAERDIHLHLGARVTAIDTEAHSLTLADGSTADYTRLLLATGGRSFVPPFEGVEQAGVFTLRTLEDAQAIKAYAQDISTAVVIGGGLLGLETGHSLVALGLHVAVIEFFPRLMPRQLDEEGAAVLQAHLESVGLHPILTGAKTKAILGDGHAAGVLLESGRIVGGELILISTGIRSRIELAREAGLEVHRGVIVDEQLRTSVPDVFAAGDVAEFDGRVYGIIPAAVEQARVAAANMAAEGSALYTGTVMATSLKIAGADLTCLGDATAEGDDVVVLRYSNQATGTYKRLALREDRIVGAILLKDKQSIFPLKQLIATGRDVSAYQDRLLDEDFDLKAVAQSQAV